MIILNLSSNKLPAWWIFPYTHFSSYANLMIIYDYTWLYHPNFAWNESFRRQKSKRKETESLINRNQTPINILSSHKLKIYESLKKQISSWDRIGRVEADNRKKAILGVSENKLWFILLFRSGFFHNENLTLIFTKEFGKMIYLWLFQYWIYFSPIQIIDSSVQMFALPVSQYISTNINNTKGLNAATYLLSLAILTHIYTLYLDLSCYRKYFIKIKSMSCASCLRVLYCFRICDKNKE